jgi:phosphoribosyl 1,2-cyclic phosphate phosphodiesterase
VRDKRLRCSVHIISGDVDLVIDVSPDFRAQMLRTKVRKIDGILFTHEHADHVAGLDDIRPYNYMQREALQVYGEERLLHEITTRFAYIFDENPYPGSPKVFKNLVLAGNEFTINGLSVMPIRIMHGSLPILGFRIGNFAYLTDVKSIPQESIDLLQNLDVLVINALRYEPHHSHLSFEESLEMIEKLNPKAAYLTHISHTLGPVADWEKKLPNNVFSAVDGLEVEVGE